ncbi:glycosyltransferase, partial [Cutibacterium acnes]
MTVIPKTIHYCWFGQKDKPDIVKRCMETWHQQLTDYRMVEWNEDNFDVEVIPYVQEAYEHGKFAFVSDYARVHALYHEGGIYLDTDVEVFQSFDPLLHHDSFWGYEQGNFIATSTIGAKPKNVLIERFLSTYERRSFLKPDGTYDSLTNVAVVTDIMKKFGFRSDGSYQEVDGVGVCYPQPYFSPYDYINCRNLTTDETFTLHHFHKSWL